MIDINLLRNDIEALNKILKHRGFDLDVNFFNSLEEERKYIQIKTQELQQERNDLSKQVGILKSQGKDASAVLEKVTNISTQSKEFESQLILIQEKINNFLRSQAEPDYVDEILNFADEKEMSEGSKNQSDKDELYQSAVDIIKSEGKASTSFLQRKLQIGYNRAARMIDMMEAEGIVSKANHVGKRDVL